MIDNAFVPITVDTGCGDCLFKGKSDWSYQGSNDSSYGGISDLSCGEQKCTEVHDTRRGYFPYG